MEQKATVGLGVGNMGPSHARVLYTVLVYDALLMLQASYVRCVSIRSLTVVQPIPPYYYTHYYKNACPECVHVITIGIPI